MRKIEGLKESGTKFKYDMVFMRAVVQEYETSDFSSAQIAHKYGIGPARSLDGNKDFLSDFQSKI